MTSEIRRLMTRRASMPARTWARCATSSNANQPCSPIWRTGSPPPPTGLDRARRHRKQHTSPPIAPRSIAHWTAPCSVSSPASSTASKSSPVNRQLQATYDTWSSPRHDPELLVLGSQVGVRFGVGGEQVGAQLVEHRHVEVVFDNDHLDRTPPAAESNSRNSLEARDTLGRLESECPCTASSSPQRGRACASSRFWPTI